MKRGCLPRRRSELVKALNQLTVPLILPDGRPIILDGESWGLRIERGMAASLELCWRLQAPEPWAPVRDWWRAAAGAFEQALPPHEPPLCAHHPWIA